MPGIESSVARAVVKVSDQLSARLVGEVWFQRATARTAATEDC